MAVLTGMKLFISWSGKHSQQAANALRDWLPQVLPGTEPWISSEDIRKGSAWFSELSEGLAESVFGIICVDPSNVDAPWVLCEAGAVNFPPVVEAVSRRQEAGGGTSGFSLRLPARSRMLTTA